MRSNTIKPVISVLFSLMAIGQPSAALNLLGLRFTYTETQNFQEIADLIRTMTDVPWASVDNAKTLWLYGGKSDQITLAEWLFHELDKPATGELPGSQGQISSTPEYRVPGASDSVVRVFYLTHTRTASGLQEIVVAIRSVAEIQRVVVYRGSQAMVLRGTQGEMASAEWMINALDKPAGEQTLASQSPAIPQYRLSNDRYPEMRVFHLSNTAEPQASQEITNMVRSQTEMQRVILCFEQRALVVRGTLDQVALAERLIQERDRPGVH